MQNDVNSIYTLGANKALPKALKTGTTIVGVIYKGGVVLGADTRATEVRNSERARWYRGGCSLLWTLSQNAHNTGVLTSPCMHTRARTQGPIVADKNCEKIHKISKNIWCCGAGGWTVISLQTVLRT